MEKGIEQGKNQNKIEIAKKMLDMKIDIKVIMEATSLTEEEIKNLEG